MCEYKYSLSYGREERSSHEKEYVINEEGCYILEVHLPTGKWLCLDATLQQFRKINKPLQASHMQSQTAQSPLHERKVEGGSQDIKEGEELSYDYGDQHNKPEFMKLTKVYISNAGEH